jgi:TonB family protein
VQFKAPNVPSARACVRFRFTLAALLLVAVFHPRSVLAQSVEPAAEARVVPPRLIHDPGVRYPESELQTGLHERVRVELVLEIDASGQVAGAVVEHPARPAFDDPARSAALGLVFEPAQRAGVPTAARIRFVYVFEPPPPTLSGSVFDANTGAPIADARVSLLAGGALPAPLAAAETGSDGSWSLAAADAATAELRAEAAGYAPQQIPVVLASGAETHAVFRLEREQGAPAPTPESTLAPIEVMVRGQRLAPAVTSFTRAEVRQLPGAFGDPFRAIEVMPGVTPVVSGLPFFYVRGAPPGNVGYFLDGIRVPYLYHVGFGPSVIHPALVERVALYPGGYPARFGRFAGGIVSAEVRDPALELRAEGNLRLFDAGALVETPLADGRGSALVGGRYSYTAALLSALAPDIVMDYRDYQARIEYELTPDDRIGLFGFGSYDLLGTEQDGALSVLFGSEFYRLSVRHAHEFERASLRTSLTFGFDQSKNEFLGGTQSNVRTRSLALASTLELELGGAALLRTGIDTALEVFSVERSPYFDPASPESQDFEQLFPPRTDTNTGAWVDAVLDLTPSIELTPGCRLDVYHSGGATAVGVDPRIAARFEVSDRVTIVHAYGLAHQPPAFVLPIPGLTPGELSGGLQTAAQASAGVELDLPSALNAKVSFFYNAFFDMSDAIGTAEGDGPPDFTQRSQGSAVGAEVSLRRSLNKRLGGFLSYTLSRSLRSIGREKFPSAVDRTHVANAALGYDLGRGWRPGARAVFYSGTPAQASPAGSIATRTTDVTRKPPFFRLDVRIEKRWQFERTGWLSFVLEVLNATLSTETFGDDEIGPVTLPSIGIEGGF